MNEIRYIKDYNRPNDKYTVGSSELQRVNSKINIYNEQTGELIFEGHNKTVIAGSALTAMKLFSLDRNVLDATPTYNAALELDSNTTDKHPAKVIVDANKNILGSTPDETQRIIIGFCVGQGGAGLDISDVFDVEYCSWITPDSIIPFRYPRVNEDAVDKDIYKGLKSNRELEDGTKVNAYYFKKFSNTPKLVQNYVSTIGTFSDEITSDNVYLNSASTDKAQSYVELHLKITKEDCREFFIAHKGIENAKINQISLVSAWEEDITVGTETYSELQDIRPFSVINIPNEIISNREKSLSIIYTLYF